MIAISSDGTRAGSQTTTFLVSPPPPYISAIIVAGVSGITGAQQVTVLTNTPANNGQPISNATVTVNGTVFPYNSNSNTYVGNVTIAAGTAVNLSVTANGATYTATANEFSTYPSITAPTNGTAWSPSGASNNINWSVGAPTTGAYYLDGIMDNSNNGNFVFPASGGPQEALISGATTKSVNVPANTLAGSGSYTVLVGILNGTDGSNGTVTAGGTTIPNALTGSAMLVGAGASVQITTSGAQLAHVYISGNVGTFGSSNLPVYWKDGALNLLPLNSGYGGGYAAGIAINKSGNVYIGGTQYGGALAPLLGYWKNGIFVAFSAAAGSGTANAGN